MKQVLKQQLQDCNCGLSPTHIKGEHFIIFDLQDINFNETINEIVDTFE